jgi:hypothetical protein
MRRIPLVLALTVGLVIGTMVPGSALGETSVTLNCDDGTSVQLLLDADTLTSLTASIQAMLDYPAGLTCTLIQNPLGGLSFFGHAALAAPGQEPFIVGGGRWQVPCSAIFLADFNPNPGGGSVEGGVVARVPDASSSWSKVSARLWLTPSQQEEVFIWVNIAVNVHQKAGTPPTFYGSLNETIPAGQFCPTLSSGDVQVGESHFSSKPTCLLVDSSTTPPIAFVTSQVTKASDGSGQVPFPAPIDQTLGTGSVAPTDFVHFGFQDNGNPPGQNPTLTPPTTDMLDGVPDMPEGTQSAACTTEWPPARHLGDFAGTKQFGNLTLHP